MKTNYLDKINNAILKSMDFLVERIQQNKATQVAISERLSFEKWMQFEMAHSLLESFSDEKNIKLSVEFPAKKNSGKRSEAIDIVLFIDDKKYFAIELKVVLTNYKVTGVKPKGKQLTDYINSMMNDFDKMKNEGYPYYISLSLALPLPIDENHVNNTRDFLKQKNKLSKIGNLYSKNAEFTNLFRSCFLLLASYEIHSSSLNKENKLRIAKIHSNQTASVAKSDRDYTKVEVSDSSNIFSFKLGNEAYYKGVISFKSNYHKNIPDKSCLINIKIPGHTNSMQKSFTSSGTNRKINDSRGEIKNWFQQNYKLGDVVKILIRTPTDFELIK